MSETTDIQEPPATSLFDWLTPGRFALLLGALIAAAFPGVLFGGESFFRGDYGVLAYPAVAYFRESFWRGELPLWNPLSNCGAPFLAQWGTMVLYPGSLIYLLLPLPWSLGFCSLLHLWLGGMGMFKLAERWTGHRFAAGVAGVAFVFNGITLACLVWPNYAVALGWMPWVVLLTERAWREGGRTLVLAALAGAMQMLSGVPELVLMTWLVVIALALLEVQSSKFKVQSWLPVLGRFALVTLLVAGLCAAQLLPFFDLLAHSQRDAGFATAKWAMPGLGWANLLVPLFHCAMTPQGFYFQQGQEFLTSTYLGAATLALALLAVWRVRERHVWLLAALTLFALVMALGENSFVYSWLRRLLPATGLARYPVKFVLLAAFAVPLLAAFGVRWCAERKAESGLNAWRPWLVTCGALALAAVALVWFAQAYPLSIYDRVAEIRGNAITRLVFLALTAGALIVVSRTVKREILLGTSLTVLTLITWDAATHLPRQNPTLPAALFAADAARTTTKLEPTPRHGESRVMISPASERKLLFSEVADWGADFGGKRLAFWSHLNLLDGVPKVNGSSTLQLREQAALQKLLYATNTTKIPLLMDFLGVAHVTAPGQVTQWTNRNSWLPLATTGQEPKFAVWEHALMNVVLPGFDPRAEVYLPTEAQALAKATNRSAAKITSARFTARRGELEVSAPEAAWVVVAQSYYHPWRAFVDGQPTRLWRANFAFQALEVPAGTHRVELVYRDRSFVAGAVISIATLLLCLVLWRRAPLGRSASIPPAQSETFPHES